MKKAIILNNAYTQSPQELARSKRMREELARLGVEANILRNCPSALEAEGDFCVFFDKDKYAARALEKRMRLFDRAEAVEVCDDKMLTYLALHGIAQPETISSRLCYTADAPVDERFLDDVEGRLGYPVVVKENHGSLGKEVYLARDRAELSLLAARLQYVPHIYQKFIAESCGRDMRVICVGGEVVACMKRTNERDFRSNLAAGGRGEPFEADEDIRRLASAVCARLGLDYCGIDLLFAKEGYLVCEVNSNAFFSGIEKVTGINVAAAYARHIFNEVYHT